MNILLFNLYKKNNKIYTKSKIEKDIPILEFKGIIFSGDKSYPENLVLDLPNNKYIGPSGEYDDDINHSCNPNSRIEIVNTRAFLYSIKTIKPDEEITFDYSTIIKSDYCFDCNCKSFNCRKKISNIKSLNKDTFDKYKKLKMIPTFILRFYE